MRKRENMLVRNRTINLLKLNMLQILMNHPQLLLLLLGLRSQPPVMRNQRIRPPLFLKLSSMSLHLSHQHTKLKRMYRAHLRATQRLPLVTLLHRPRPIGTRAP
jgi:hypothetical protein